MKKNIQPQLQLDFLKRRLDNCYQLMKMYNTTGHQTHKIISLEKSCLSIQNQISLIENSSFKSFDQVQQKSVTSITQKREQQIQQLFKEIQQKEIQIYQLKQQLKGSKVRHDVMQKQYIGIMKAMKEIMRENQRLKKLPRQRIQPFTIQEHGKYDLIKSHQQNISQNKQTAQNNDISLKTTRKVQIRQSLQSSQLIQSKDKQMRKILQQLEQNIQQKRMIFQQYEAKIAQQQEKLKTECNYSFLKDLGSIIESKRQQSNQPFDKEQLLDQLQFENQLLRQQKQDINSKLVLCEIQNSELKEMKEKYMNEVIIERQKRQILQQQYEKYRRLQQKRKQQLQQEIIHLTHQFQKISNSKNHYQKKVVYLGRN